MNRDTPVGMRGTNGTSRVLNHEFGLRNVSLRLCAGLIVFAAAGGVVIQTSSEAAAQAELGADGLPIYDDRLGRPRSRLIDITAPISAVSPMTEAPATSEPVASRAPARSEPLPEPADTSTVADEPLVDAPGMVAEASPETIDVAVTETAPETEPEAAQPEPEPPTVTAAVEQSAEAPQSAVPAIPGTIAVLFPPGGAELPSDAQPQLDSVVAALGADSGVRLQLKAYADGSDVASSAARRLSLSRALAVRGYLIDAGVSSTRIDVRALGSKFESGPADRVDVISLK